MKHPVDIKQILGVVGLGLGMCSSESLLFVSVVFMSVS